MSSWLELTSDSSVFYTSLTVLTAIATVFLGYAANQIQRGNKKKESILVLLFYRYEKEVEPAMATISQLQKQRTDAARVDEDVNLKLAHQLMNGELCDQDVRELERACWTLKAFWEFVCSVSLPDDFWSPWGEWLPRGKRYLVVVEPIDIASYYHNQSDARLGHYLELENRPWPYRKIERELRDAEESGWERSTQLAMEKSQKLVPAEPEEERQGSFGDQWASSICDGSSDIGQKELVRELIHALKNVSKSLRELDIRMNNGVDNGVGLI